MTLAGTLQNFLRRIAPKRFYCEDALITTHTHDFVDDPEFRKAYKRGLEASEGRDAHNQWRIFIALWLARVCSKLEGDYIECGVNYGFTSSAIMEYLHWDKLEKQFWLVDSFAGIDEGQATEEEKAVGALKRNRVSKRIGFYNSSAERCKQNFSQWKNVKIVQGWIPDCLSTVTASKVAFMHIDLNSASPEIQTFKHFLPKLSPGAFVLLDDYAYTGFETTYAAWNNLGRELNFEVLALPTGQGLVHIPPIPS